MRLNRIGAVGGLAFVVLNLVTIVIAGQPPAPDASQADIAQWLADHATGIEVGSWLSGVSAVALVYWFGPLWRKGSAAENGKPTLSVIALGGLLLSGAFFLTAAAVQSTMAMRHEDGGDSVVLYALVNVCLSMAGLFIAVLTSAISALVMKTQMLPAWIAYLGYLVAVLQIGGSAGVAHDKALYMAMGIAGFLLWCVWILAISWDLWRKPPSEA